MSQYYHLNEQMLWNPSNGVSGLFLHQVRMFEQELDLPSGVGPMEGDESQIAPALLEKFIAALLAWRGRTNHVVVQVLTSRIHAG